MKKEKSSLWKYNGSIDFYGTLGDERRFLKQLHYKGFVQGESRSDAEEVALDTLHEHGRSMVGRNMRIGTLDFELEVDEYEIINCSVSQPDPVSAMAHLLFR